MNSNELNQYIKHYFENDRTHSAIMLTGDWGTGKSHYIQHELIPFLDTEAEKRCIVVSLYGLKDTVEISKSIYLEVRAKKVEAKAKAETVAAGKLAAKTIAKGVTSFFGIDLSADESDLAKLYESIDLSHKLIILEDIERSQIGIQELLGFVNNLVEQDGIKVLLVANEKEILTYTEGDPDEKGNMKHIPTEHTLTYRKIKEKTVSDTILYSCDYDRTITSIISDFGIHAILDIEPGSAKERIVITEIAIIMMDLRNYNLRSLIFACQKTSDLFVKSKCTGNSGFWRTIFYGIIAFSLRIKSGFVAKWPENTQLSHNHGTEKYPLYKFAYDYIYCHKLDIDSVKAAETIYVKAEQSYKRINDPDLAVLYSYHEQSEKTVIATIHNVLAKLKNDDIEPNQFGKIANHLIALKPVVGCCREIDECKNLILQALKSQPKEFSELSLFSSGLSIDNKDARQEFMDFKTTVLEIFKAAETSTIMNFDYSPDSIPAFASAVQKEKDHILSNRKYARLFDIGKLRHMLANCSSKQLQDFRSTFLSVYYFSNINEYYTEDKPALEEILEIVQSLKDLSGFDNIQKLQMCFFADNLESILQRL